MTGKDPAHNAGPTAFTWYDELIVSTQAIAAPNNKARSMRSAHHSK
jgi:hypothetical protein